MAFMSPKLANSVIPTGSSGGRTVSASWTEQDSELKERWLGGDSPQAIAESLGRSVAAIMTRAARLGLPRRFAPGRKPQPRDEGQTGNIRAYTPRPRLLPATTSTRICLMCLSPFPSQGKHNRICHGCKDSPEYATGSSLPDIDYGY